MKHDEFQFLKDQISKKDISVKIVSDSMVPFVHVGQVIKVSALTCKPSRFDIVVFLGANHKLICHVVMEVFDKHLVTKGSKNGSNMDQPILISNILGIVREIQLSRFYKIKTALLYYLKK